MALLQLNSCVVGYYQVRYLSSIPRDESLCLSSSLAPSQNLVVRSELFTCNSIIPSLFDPQAPLIRLAHPKENSHISVSARKLGPYYMFVQHMGPRRPRDPDTHVTHEQVMPGKSHRQFLGSWGAQVAIMISYALMVLAGCDGSETISLTQTALIHLGSTPVREQEALQSDNRPLLALRRNTRALANAGWPELQEDKNHADGICHSCCGPMAQCRLGRTMIPQPRHHPLDIVG
jgi:hypothetical protein